MKTYFSTVPIEVVRTRAAYDREETQLPVVLVVDEDQSITYTVGEILSRSGFAAIPACSSKEALETAKLIPPDVLITDSSMRGTNGLELARQVRRIAPECKLILIAGDAVTAGHLGEAGMERGDLAILSRPVHPADLLDCIHKSLACRRGPTSALLDEGDRLFSGCSGSASA